MISSTIDLSPESVSSRFQSLTEKQLPTSVAETAQRVLFATVKWAKSLPAFGSLTALDQLTLLESGWPELFLLSAFQWSFSLDKCPLFSPSETNCDLIHQLIQIFEHFKSANLDQAEIGCLKAIVLFRPEIRGLGDPQQVLNLQDQSQLMLAQHVSRTMPSNPTRFGRLLLLLPILNPNPLKLEQIYFSDQKGGMRKLITEIIKS